MWDIHRNPQAASFSHSSPYCGSALSCGTRKIQTLCFLQCLFHGDKLSSFAIESHFFSSNPEFLTCLLVLTYLLVCWKQGLPMQWSDLCATLQSCLQNSDSTHPDLDVTRFFLAQINKNVFWVRLTQFHGKKVVKAEKQLAGIVLKSAFHSEPIISTGDVMGMIK